jgi:hypothetical protein
MSTFTTRVARRTGAARTIGLPALLTVLALALPAAASAQSTVTPAPGAAPAAAPATPPSATTVKRPARHSAGGIDRRIADLHKRLKITPAEEPQWKQVADIMRQNEEAVAAAVKDRVEHMKTMNAMENLQSFQKIADAHDQGLQKLIPAFQALYDSMSDAQKKNADAVFRAVAERHARPHAKAKKAG